MELLSIENVSKIIGKEKILEGVNLRIKDNTIYGLIGENGSGKTTLLKMILGLYKTSSGSIYQNGIKIDENLESYLNNIAAVIDTPNVYEYLTGRKNLIIFNIIGKNIKMEKIDKIINNLNMTSYIDKPVSTYSLGMKQRLSLAICLLQTPKILILDEPLNGLDPIGIKELREILLELKVNKKMGIIISSHILSELKMICDKVIYIKDRQISKVIDMKQKEENLEELFDGGGKKLEKTNKI